MNKFFLLCGIFAYISGCASILSSPQKPFSYHYTNTQLSFSADQFPQKDVFKIQESFPIKIAQARLRQSEALYQSSLSFYFPQVNATLQRNQQKFSPFMVSPNRLSKLTTYQAGLSVQLVPDFFGKTKLQAEIAQSQQASSFYNVELVKLNTINAYTKNYHLICYLEKLQEIQRKTYHLNEKIFKVAQQRYDNGLVDATDFYLAKDSLYVSESSLGNTKQSYELAKKNYDTLLGKSYETTSNEICQKGFVDLPTNNPEVPLNVLDNRPDIQMVQIEVQRATQNYDLSLKAIYPDTSLIFNVSDLSDNVRKIFDAKEIAWSFISQLNQLIYDGGRRGYNQDIAKDDVGIASMNYKNLVIDAVNTVKQLGSNFKSAHTNEAIALKRLNDAQKALTIAKLNYASGLISLMQFLNLERNFYNAQLELINSQHEKRIIYTDLLTALGGRAINLGASRG